MSANKYNNFDKCMADTNLAGHSFVQADIIACHDCDLLLKDQQLEAERTASCPRCAAVLHVSRRNTLQRTLALSIAGLILFIPANILPILTFEALGKSNTSTMINGIVTIASEGYWWMGVLVFFCSIFAPFIKLLLLTITSAGCLLQWPLRLLVRCQKLYQHLDEWGMFDVYLLGILVSFIKMKDYGVLVPGVGMWCFVGLLLIAACCSSVYDSQYVWRQIDARRRRINAA